MGSSATTVEINEVEDANGAAHAGRTLLFVLGEETYGCELTSVREIIAFRAAARLPGAPDFVCGLVNLRGTLVTVLDLGLRLGRLSSARPDGSVVLVDLGAKVVGVAVDEVRDVRPLGEDQIEVASGDAARGGVVRGIGHLGDGIVVLLDMHTLVRQVLL